MSEREHRWVVDAIEESIASVEADGDHMISIPVTVLPAAAREGDVLSVRIDRPAKGDRTVVTIAVDHAATQQALADSAAQVKRGRKRSHDPGGDVTL